MALRPAVYILRVQGADTRHRAGRGNRDILPQEKEITGLCIIRVEY